MPPLRHVRLDDQHFAVIQLEHRRPIDLLGQAAARISPVDEDIGADFGLHFVLQVEEHLVVAQRQALHLADALDDLLRLEAGLRPHRFEAFDGELRVTLLLPVHHAVAQDHGSGLRRDFGPVAGMACGTLRAEDNLEIAIRTDLKTAVVEVPCEAHLRPVVNRAPDKPDPPAATSWPARRWPAPTPQKDMTECSAPLGHPLLSAPSTQRSHLYMYMQPGFISVLRGGGGVISSSCLSSFVNQSVTLPVKFDRSIIPYATSLSHSYRAPP